MQYSYNALKQLTSMQDWLGTTTVKYDEMGRATHVADFEGKEIGYVLDELGRNEKLIYPDGKEVLYEHDTSGRLHRIITDSGVTRYAYDELGQIKEQVLPDSTITTYERNSFGRLEKLTHMKDGNILDRFCYTYDPVGNITKIEKSRSGMEADSGVFQYAYDSLGRLVSATHGDDIKRYRYDELGNRVKEWKGQKYDAGKSIIHNYNTMNQLIRTQEGDAVKEYRYDGRGNLTNITENGQLKASYTFDATNRMAEAFAQGSGRARYTYDGFLNRVKKMETLQDESLTPDPLCEVRYILDLTQPYDNLLMTQGAQNQSFVWGKDLISADGDDRIYYLQDHLGSPTRLLGDGFDTPLAYDEFGVPLVDGVQGGKARQNPFGFTKYLTDSVTGLYYARARYYDPLCARFTAQDPIRDGWNFYSYCDNNPLVFLDPLGLEPVQIGTIYEITWEVNGEPRGYAGQSKDFVQRFNNHKFKSIIRDPKTTVRIRNVYGEITPENIAASGSRSYNSALREAMSTSEQAAADDLKSRGYTLENGNRPARSKKAAAARAKTYNTSHGEWMDTELVGKRRVPKTTGLKNGVKLASNRVVGCLILWDAIKLASEMNKSKYVYQVYQFQDGIGTFTMHSQQTGFMGLGKEKFMRRYIDGGFAGQTISIDREEYKEAKEETEALFGYVNFWGEFVPGILQPELPVIEVPSSYNPL